VRHQFKTPECDEMTFATMIERASAVPEMEKHYYWIDIFFKNQHYVETDKQKLAEYLTRQIKMAGTLVLCMDRVPKPAPFSRVWCLYEILIAIDGEAALLDIAMSFGAGLTIYHRRGDEGLSTEMVESIDVRLAEATKEDDKRMIMELIENKVGAEDMTNQLRGTLAPAVQKLQHDMMILWPV